MALEGPSQTTSRAGGTDLLLIYTHDRIYYKECGYTHDMINVGGKGHEKREEMVGVTTDGDDGCSAGWSVCRRVDGFSV